MDMMRTSETKIGREYWLAVPFGNTCKYVSHTQLLHWESGTLRTLIRNGHSSQVSSHGWYTRDGTAVLSPMAHHPPTIQSSLWAVQTADAFRCSTDCSYEPWLEHRRLRLLPAGHTFVAERCIQPHCSSQLGEYPAMTLSRSSALGKRHESGFVLVNSGP